MENKKKVIIFSGIVFAMAAIAAIALAFIFGGKDKPVEPAPPDSSMVEVEPTQTPEPTVAPTPTPEPTPVATPTPTPTPEPTKKPTNAEIMYPQAPDANEAAKEGLDREITPGLQMLMNNGGGSDVVIEPGYINPDCPPGTGPDVGY